MANRRVFIVVGVAALFATLVAAGTTTTTYQRGNNGYTGTQDAYIYVSAPNNNYGTTTTLSIEGNPRQQAIIYFPNLYLPLGSTVTSATLRVRTQSNTNAHSGNTFQVRSLLFDWGNETSVTWNSVSGGISKGGGETSANLATISLSSRNTYYNANVKTAVQGWADGTPNYGFAILPNSDSNTDWASIWSSEVGTVDYRPRLIITVENSFDSQCRNGTLNDLSVELPSPVLIPPTITGNNYEFGYQVDQRFERVQVQFGASVDNNACNFDSDADNHDLTWKFDNDAACGATLTMSRAAQDMLATCAFARSDTATEAVFTKTVNVVTTQWRSVSYQQAFRNWNYTQIKTTLYTLTVTIPKNIQVNSTAVDVTGNVTVLQALQSVAVDVLQDPYHLTFQVITSSQDPYQLEHLSYHSTSNDLSDTATVSTPLPNCEGSSPDLSCTQIFTYSDIDIVTSCESKTRLSSDEVHLSFTIGCKSSFSGNCETPNPNTVNMSFLLSSTDYCPQVLSVDVTATMNTYRDVSLTDPTWDEASKTTQYVIGSTVYGQVDLTVGNDAATLSTTTLRTLKTYGDSNAEVVVYDTGVNIANVQNTGFTGDTAATRWSVLLTNGESVALDAVQDAAQAVKFTAVVDMVYVINSGLPSASNPVLQALHRSNHEQVARVETSKMALSSNTESGSSSASATVVIGPATVGDTTNASSSSSGAASSTLVMVAVAAGVALVAMGAAYRMGVSTGIDDKEEPEESQTEEMLSVTTLEQSASSTELGGVEESA